MTRITDPGRLPGVPCSLVAVATLGIETEI
jgi:hypothetical protein